jgi:hypothetical protein
MVVGKGKWNNLEFQLEGVKFIAYWCITEGETSVFPKVRSLEKTNSRLLKRAHTVGIQLLQNKNTKPLDLLPTQA